MTVFAGMRHRDTIVYDVRNFRQQTSLIRDFCVRNDYIHSRPVIPGLTSFYRGTDQPSSLYSFIN